jgi:hypothetical protein
MITVTIRTLEKLDACDDGIRMFIDNLGAEASLDETVKWAISNGKGNNEALYYANWLLARFMPRIEGLKYGSFACRKALEAFKDYSQLVFMESAVKAAEDCIKDDCETNRQWAHKMSLDCHKLSESFRMHENYTCEAMAQACFRLCWSAYSGDRPNDECRRMSCAAAEYSMNANPGVREQILLYGLELALEADNDC